MSEELRSAILLLLDQRYKSDPSRTVDDAEIAAELRADIAEVRRQMDILENQGFTHAANTYGGNSAWISPRGMLAAEKLRPDTSKSPSTPAPDVNSPDLPGTRIFISHSSQDAALAHSLVDLLRSAVNLPTRLIRCTSVDGHRLEGGAQTDLQLRKEIASAEVFLGLVSPISIESAYVLFEMGARWGSNLPLIPLLAPGADTTHLRGPLAGMNALRCTSEADLHQLVEQVSSILRLTPEPPAAYLQKVRAVQQFKPHPASASNPAPERVTPPLDLTTEHESLIKLFAQAEWQRARAEKIAEMTEMNRTRTQHLLDQLRDARLVAITMTKLGAAYYLTKEGRAYAVEKGYC